MNRSLSPRLYFLLVWLSQVLLLPCSGGQSLDRRLQRLVDDDIVKGVAAAYAQGDSVVWRASHGLRSQSPDIPFLYNTPSRIASIAKLMTAVAIMQLVEKNLLDLDQPLHEYLPDFPNGDNITTRHLLGHTAGIGGYDSSEEAETTLEYNSLLQACDIFKNRNLLFHPGQSFSYSTYGYVVLGLLIETISNTPFTTHMKSHIWDIAQMENTGVVKYKKPILEQSELFHRNKKKIKPAKENNLSNRILGGGFYSTVPDLLKFGQAILNHKLINKQTFMTMLDIQYSGKEGNPYGLGWCLYGPPPNEHAVIGHAGEQTGVSAQLMIVPSKNMTVVVISNTSGAWEEIVQYSTQIISHAIGSD